MYLYIVSRFRFKVSSNQTFCIKVYIEDTNYLKL